ncbi:stage II sporulation protein M [Candidatus Pacearchaeota archaeon]|nr:stage II sporulation protein M [Candidatus Pacearchaeota archaeon]
MKNSITKNYKISLKFLNDSRSYIYFCMVLFSVFFFIGLVLPTPNYISNQILDFIEKLLLETEGMNQFEITNFILINNLRSSFFTMAFGVFLGISPIVMIIVNGYLLGFVSSLSVGALGIASLWKLFPHGIFELPAVFISAGLGLQLGFPFVYRYFRYYFEKKNFIALLAGILFLFPSVIVTLLFNKKLRKEQMFDFAPRVKNSLKVFFFIVIPLLVVAAIIEGALISW